jgi:glycosyltransferase involved in cell wall biosynthesis
VIRVALVVGRLNIGGAEAELVRLANGLDRSRFEPFVVTLQDPGPLADRLRDVELVSLGFRRKWSWRTYAALRDLLRVRKPDVVQTFLFTENVFCRSIGAGVVVSGLQGGLSDGSESGPSPKIWVDRLTWPRAAAVVSNSAFYRDRYAALGFDVSRVRVIPSAVEPVAPRDDGAGIRREFGIRDDEVLFTVLARLVERKGHEDLIRAGAGFKLLFVGDGPFRRRLEGRGAILAGWRRDVPEILAASDVVALPSRFGEGCPNAALEAMAAGRPVLAVRSGGTPEAVEDGVTGLLVPPGDLPALRDAMHRLAAGPDLRRRLGAAGRERVRAAHSVERLLRDYGRLYDDLTTARTPV